MNETSGTEADAEDGVDADVVSEAIVTNGETDGTATAESEKGAAVVTGATRGIGYELARLFAGTGHDVVLVARTEADLHERADHLSERFGVRAEPVPADLTDPDAAERVYEATEAAEMDVTTLVNNAGFGTGGRFDRSDPDDALGVVDVNVSAVTRLTRLYLPELIADDRQARLLNVASAAAFVPGPKTAVYNAASAYELSFSESLAAELADEDVTVTCLCPGPVDTEFHERAGTESRSTPIPTPTMDARSVARAGFRGLRQGETVVIPGLTMRLLIRVARLLPRPVLRRAMRYYNRGV